MDSGIIITAAAAYLALLFLVAYIADKKGWQGKSMVNHPVVYALSLTIYCTAWTFYGSVGRASVQGPGFLPIYLGPLIISPLFFVLLKKIILISKAQRITSIADFISARYGKSSTLGIVVTLICVFGVIPYISIQLKAIAASFAVLKGELSDLDSQSPFYFDAAWYITIALTVFTILFGTRHLDPNERHEGLIAAVAFESVVKLVAFLAVGIYVTYGVFNGFGDLFEKTSQSEAVQRLFSFEEVGINGGQWFTLILISMSAVLFLPRQFHIAVVENTNPKFLDTASWLFPLYLLVINLFVIPIAVAGLYQWGEQPIDPDAFVISLPLNLGNQAMALLVALGGFAAATSMVIVAVIALSIMISNNLILPLLLKPRIWKPEVNHNINQQLLGMRRISIIVVLLLSYAYFRAVSSQFAIVSIGLISFTAIAQFIPAAIGGLYWKRATKPAAISSLLVGFFIWAITLPIPSMMEGGLFGKSVIENGWFNIQLLKPHALFGTEGWDHITHAVFWSLLFNVMTYVTVSLNTTPSLLEITQADLFVEIYKHRVAEPGEYEVIRRRAQTKDLLLLLERFMSMERANDLILNFEKDNDIVLKDHQIASPEFIKYVETHLTGAMGAASAKTIIKSVSQEDPISLEEMFEVLEQTKEIFQYNKALEAKSEELRAANEQLKELDRLKADFISTITHELRTPITSIKAFSKIMLDNPELAEAEKNNFLKIILSESDRITRLVNQVLDLRKIQSEEKQSGHQIINLNEIAREAVNSVAGLMEQKKINYEIDLPEQPVFINAGPDKIIQVIVNLLSNAIKFCNQQEGFIRLTLRQEEDIARLSVQDNGPGIKEKNINLIFDQFTQISDPKAGKPQGSGLGLYITRTIVRQYKGKIYVSNTAGSGANFIVEWPVVDPVFQIKTSE